MSSEPSTRILLRRAQTGEPQAMNELLARVRPRLVAWVTARLGPLLKSRVEAEDIVQEILIQAHAAIPAFEPRGPGSFKAWLFTIAEHCIAGESDRHRAAKRDPRREVEMGSRVAGELTSPSEGAARREEWSMMLETLKDLPERYRQVLRLRRLEHRDNQEVARIMEITPKNAAVLYVRAVRALRGALEGRRGL